MEGKEWASELYIRKPNEAMGAFSLPDVQNPETVEQGELKSGTIVS